MNEPTPSQLDWAREKLKDCPDPLTPKDLSAALNDKTTGYVLSAIRSHKLSHAVKRSGPRVRYSIDKKDAIPFLASHYRPATEELN